MYFKLILSYLNTIAKIPPPVAPLRVTTAALKKKTMIKNLKILEH